MKISTKKDCLTSRIELPVELRGRISSVKNSLSTYPNLVLVRQGTILEYILTDDEIKDHWYAVELGKKHIALVICSMQTPAIFMREAMLKLLALIQMTAKHYRFEISSLYPYLVMVIASQQINSVFSLGKEQLEEHSDLVLSKRIISLIKENADLREKYDGALGKFKKIVMKAVTLADNGNTSFDDLAKLLEIEKKDLSDALSGLRQKGYRQACTGHNRFSLVRL